MRIAVLIGALAGCYAPRFGDCVIACESSAGCPAGLACAADGLCRPSGIGASCADVLGDAGRDGDGGGGDGDGGVDAPDAPFDPCSINEPTCAPAPVASGDQANGAAHVVVDAEYAYWSLLIGDAVMRRRHAGGPIETFAANTDGALGLAIDDTHVYWVEIANSVINRKPKAGGPIEFVGAAGSFANMNRTEYPPGLALDATHVYWAHGDAVRRRAKAGGPVETIATGNDDAGRALGVAVDDTHVYWTNHGSDTVKRRSKTGTTIQTVASYISPMAVAVDNSFVYFTSAVVHGIFRRAKTGAGQTEYLVNHPDAFGAYNIVLEAGFLYWTNHYESGVLRRLATGAASATLVMPSVTDGALGVAAAASHVYYTNPLTNSVARLPRCTCGLVP